MSEKFNVLNFYPREYFVYFHSTSALPSPNVYHRRYSTVQTLVYIKLLEAVGC